MTSCNRLFVICDNSNVLEFLGYRSLDANTLYPLKILVKKSQGVSNLETAKAKELDLVNWFTCLDISHLNIWWQCENYTLKPRLVENTLFSVWIRKFRCHERELVVRNSKKFRCPFKFPLKKYCPIIQLLNMPQQTLILYRIWLFVFLLKWVFSADHVCFVWWLNIPLFISETCFICRQNLKTKIYIPLYTF